MRNKLPFHPASSLLIHLFIYCTVGHAQQITNSPTEVHDENYSKLDIKLHVGATASVMGGEWVNRQKGTVLNSDTTFLSYRQFNPGFGFYVGGSIAFPINSQFSLSTGLMITQRKFKEKLLYAFYHPTLQYDEELINEITYQTIFLNVPLLAKLTMLPWAKPFIGIGLNIPFSSNAHVKTMESTVVNGELDAERTNTIRDTTLDWMDDTNRFVYSFEAGLEIPLNNRLGVTLSAERVSHVFISIDTHLWTGKIGLSYQLNY